MIVVLNPGASPERTQHLIHWLEEQNLGVHVSKGEYQTVLGLIGDTSKVDMEMLQSLDIVDSVTAGLRARSRRSTGSSTPRTPSSRPGLPRIGGGHFCHHRRPLLRGDARSRSLTWPRPVKAAGANMLRGGAFKPRTSPYDFQGLQAEGIRAAAGGQEGDRPAHRHRDHEHRRICLCSRTWT